MDRYGASPEAWDYFVALGLTEHLLPVVSNPNAEIGENSNMVGLGKTPSIYNRNGKVAGFPKWTQHRSTAGQVAQWKRQADYGICIQARAIRAFDIDVDDFKKAQAINKAIPDAAGVSFPIRGRANSEKLLLPFRLESELYKRVVPVDGGIVEVLADGQQFIAEGTHPSGRRYEWFLPFHGVPTLTEEQFEAVWQLLVTVFATGEVKIARERRRRQVGDAKPRVHDEVADWLGANWETYGVGPDRQLFIECPFADEHTGDSGPSATAYFPAGTGGYLQGHFVCLHAHCQGRDDRDFKERTGYFADQFDDVSGGAKLPLQGRASIGNSNRSSPDAVHAVPAAGQGARASGSAEPFEEGAPDWPKLKRDSRGVIESNATNLVAAIRSQRMIEKRIVYDSFTDALLWAPPGTNDFRRFGDPDMVAVRIQLEHRGFHKAIGRELLRDCIAAAAHVDQIDTAKTWLSGLRWDGVSRMDRFCVDVWGWEDTPYARAVGQYVWTGLAGRVMEPGVRADMAPILIGAQGIRKTTLIQSMAPNEEFYAEIKLDERDADQSRRLRGKLVAELEELRGLNSRAVEEIKAFISRRREAWVPKFKEFESFFWRRNLFIGTGNDGKILADPTGERRWLPGRCVRPINVELLLETRDQLWAEGATMFALDGIAWRDAEALAKEEHYKFKIGDIWQRRIELWLYDEPGAGPVPMAKGYVTVDEVMTQALGLPIGQQDRRNEIRVERALSGIGLTVDGDRWVKKA